MKSNESKWLQKSSCEIKTIQMKSNRFKWNPKISNEIDDKFIRTQMNSNEICKNYRKCEFIETFWEKCY